MNKYTAFYVDYTHTNLININNYKKYEIRLFVRP